MKNKFEKSWSLLIQSFNYFFLFIKVRNTSYLFHSATKLHYFCVDVFFLKKTLQAVWVFSQVPSWLQLEFYYISSKNLLTESVQFKSCFLFFAAKQKINFSGIYLMGVILIAKSVSSFKLYHLTEYTYLPSIQVTIFS
jgi:hypothetical protein